MRLPIFLIALSLVGIAQAQACQLPVLGPNAKNLTDEKSGVALTWRFAPTEPKIGEFFVVEFAVCDRTGNVTAETLRVDAQMPAHRHGMNFQPKIAAAGANMFRAEGMMFHMPGKWQLVFERRAAAGTARLTEDVVIE
jgi:hypothetical protein